MLFGTTTQFGIRAGQSATSVPEINVGYSRQEAVVMPLVANSEDDGAVQKPCKIEKPVVEQAGRDTVHPCLLVAINGKAQDSYSVLASFGAKFDGSVDSDGPGVKGGLAQYFATGVAAQMLAITGGASVVAVGDAAKAAAARVVDEDVVKQLYGDEGTRARGKLIADEYSAFQALLVSKINLTEAGTLAERIKDFETATGTAGQLSDDCTTGVAACAAAVTRNDIFFHAYDKRKDRFTQALNVWKTDKN